MSETIVGVVVAADVSWEGVVRICVCSCVKFATELLNLHMFREYFLCVAILRGERSSEVAFRIGLLKAGVGLLLLDSTKGLPCRSCISVAVAYAM